MVYPLKCFMLQNIFPFENCWASGTMRGEGCSVKALRAGSGQSHSAAKHWGSSLLMKSLLRALSSFTPFKIAEMKPEAKQQAFCLDKECPLEGAATLTCAQSSFWQCLFSLRLPVRAPLVAAGCLLLLCTKVRWKPLHAAALGCISPRICLGFPGCH